MSPNAKIYSRLPTTPGVYLFKDARGKVLYVGKAANLRRRVSSYFLRPHDRRLERMVSEIRSVKTEKTASALEALILEASLIKKLQPPYNVREKDDKSFLYLEITKEDFPRVLLVRGKSKPGGKRYGPFTSPGATKEALRLLRRLFPWSTHPPKDVGKLRPCLDYQIGLCPGTCFGGVSEKEYRRNIKNLGLFLGGNRKLVIRNLKQEMNRASNALEFEKAAKIQRQLFGLQHIQDTALLAEDKFQIPNFKFQIAAKRVEGYDISNISGTDPVGVMVVFEGGRPNKSAYRKFLIRTVSGSNDTAMLREVIRRRFKRGSAFHPSGKDKAWEKPDILLVDGGKPQVNAAMREISALGLAIPVVGIAKGPSRKKNDFLGKIPAWTDERTLVCVRDEAHRFAISFHRRRRSVRMKPVDKPRS